MDRDRRRIESRAHRPRRPVWLTPVLAFWIAAAALPETAHAGPAPNVTTVPIVDLERYAGLWYEVAKIPNRFQDKCAHGATAVYGRVEDGNLTIVNQCLKEDGSRGQVQGVAKVVEPTSGAKLKVSFVSILGWRPFWGDYWVIGLDPEYRWAIVGTPSRKYGWVLARRPSLDPADLAQVFAILEQNGYSRDAFEMSPP